MRNTLIGLAIFGIGCVEGGIEAPYSAKIVAPSDVTISWDSSYNEIHDQVGVVVMGDLMVYDSETDLPLEHIEVEMLSNWGGVYLIPAEAVQLVGYPEASIDPTDQEAIREQCTDSDGNFKSDPEWCAWYWDTETQQYYQIGGQYIATANNYSPNYFVGRTNNRGILEFYLYVDALPGTEGGYGSASVSASIGVDTAVFTVRAGE
jgi:hypothetical protein